jgi:hypothetical protein
MPQACPFRLCADAPAHGVSAIELTLGRNRVAAFAGPRVVEDVPLVPTVTPIRLRAAG